MRILPVLVAVLALSAQPTWAQHDLHRNTMRKVAAGDYGAVDDMLRKAPEDPESLYVAAVAHALRGKRHEALDAATRAVEAGLDPGRILVSDRRVLAALADTPELQAWRRRHRNRLVHGPTLGAVSTDGALIWCRTSEAGDVAVRLIPEGAAGENGQVVSSPRQSGPESCFAVTVPIHGLKPGTAYGYDVLVNGERSGSGGIIRTQAAGGQHGSCRIGFGGGAGFVPENEVMWDVVRAAAPDAFLMLGDNVYIDDPEHELTQQYCYHRRQSRPEWRRFAAQVPLYAIYDDHDFGTNDCIPGPDVDSPRWKRDVWHIFTQNWPNRSFGGNAASLGCWHDFRVGEVHVIMLDGRYYRDLKGATMLGPVQKRWLLDTLAGSDATFKVLASPVPWSPGVKPGSRDTWDGFATEREDILSFIERRNIGGVLLIAADRHRSDLRFIRRPNGRAFFEFESSKLTNRHTHGLVKTPGFIHGFNQTCSFALMEFETAIDDPTVTFRIVRIDGETQAAYTLPLSRINLPPNS